MLQLGKVVRTEGAYALVHMQKKSGCGGDRCPLSAPLIDDSQSDFYTVYAWNDIGASPGDLVLVEAKDTKVLVIAFLLYLVPIGLALAVYGLFRMLFVQELFALFGLLAGFGGAFFLLRLCNRWISVEYRVVRYAEERCNECPLRFEVKR